MALSHIITSIQETYILAVKRSNKLDSYANRCASHTDKDLSECTFILLDIETTGGNPQKNALLEIGALKVVNGEVVDRFATLVNPRMTIPDIVRGITGISARTVRNAPNAEAVMPKFLAFIGDNVLVSHNAQGDIKFLRHASLKTCHKQIKNFYLCTHLLLAKLFPDSKDRTLKGAVRNFKLPVQRGHRAEADAEMTLALFSVLLEKLQESGLNKVVDAIRYQGDIESGKKIGWALNGDELKSLPSCPAVVRLFDRERRLIFKHSCYNLAKDVRALTRYNDLPRGVLRSVLAAHSIQVKPFPNLYEAMLWEQGLQEGKCNDKQIEGYCRSLNCVYFYPERGGFRIDVGKAPAYACKVFGYVESKQRFAEFFADIAKILRIKATRRGMYLTPNSALLVELLLRGELARQQLIKKSSLNKFSEFLQSIFLNKTSDIEKLQELTLPNKLHSILDISGLIVVSNYRRDAWQLYPVARSVPIACLETGGDWQNYLRANDRYKLIYRNLQKAQKDQAILLDSGVLNATAWWILSPNNKRDRIFLDMKRLKAFKPDGKAKSNKLK